MPDLEYIWAGVVSLSVQDQLGKEINGLLISCWHNLIC